MNIKLEVERLLEFGLSKSFIHADDIWIVRNQLIDFLHLDGPYESYEPCGEVAGADDIINNILQYCFEAGLLEDDSAECRNITMAAIMGFITPKQSEVTKKFKLYYSQSPMEATDYLYNLNLDVNFIQRIRVNKKQMWDHEEAYGHLECVMSFTGHDISPSDMREETGYPKCGYCYQRVGFSGKSISGQNLRLIKLNLADETWYLGYAPQAYFDEHCVLVSEHHEEQKITINTFKVMMEFIDRYPHYFIGSDADLPMVGTSCHRHLIGGCDVFPVEYAETISIFEHPSYKNILINIINWPVSTIRIEGYEPELIVEVIELIRKHWEGYSDERIKAFSIIDGEKIQHNTIALIARKNTKGNAEIDIFLRNNITSELCPNGVYNTPNKHTNIKTSDIKLIDLMGRIVMPGGLDNEILHIMSYLMSGKKYEAGERKNILKHAEWIEFLQNKYGIIKGYNDARRVMQFEVGRKYAKILENCGVFKLSDDIDNFKQFMESAGFVEAIPW